MTNRLRDASSPYLRQHRDNPVDWYQWGDEAFEEAQRTGKPILLSVGYSACHWCHVMAHESFEDPDTAQVMNDLFINIKVDREERPDVDAIYMDAVQALTGRGGWPMTVFLTPTAEPFYGGTYYPRDTFVSLMRAVDDAWKNRRDELQQNVDALLEAISRTGQVSASPDIDARDLVGRAIGGLQQNFDARWGGFGGAPKFPSTFNLDLLLQISRVTGDETLFSYVRTSLDAMAAGGMYDHIGGGFSRYSVDEQWLVPHFEKMLYDQALLLRVYLHAWQMDPNPHDEYVVRSIVTYVLRDLSHPDGGFYSAEDADSLTPAGHSHEGAFYTWTIDEFEQILGHNAQAAIDFWGLTTEGNFEGRCIAHRLLHRGDIIGSDVIANARTTLFEARAQRHRPGLDDKVLTEWNAMMLSSLCEVAQAFQDPELITAAIRNAEFLVTHLRDAHGTWKRSWQATAEPRARHDALAHDLAHVIDAMTRMYELTGQHRWLEVAVEAASELRTHFWDHDNGGVFTVSSTSTQLIVRQKDLMDNATASANSVAGLAFLRLGSLVDDHSLIEDANSIFRLLSTIIPAALSGTGLALAGIWTQHVAITEVVIPGDSDELLSVYREQWRPDCVLAWGEPTSSSLWRERQVGNAYVCKNRACQLPAATPEELRRQLTTNSLGE